MAEASYHLDLLGHQLSQELEERHFLAVLLEALHPLASLVVVSILEVVGLVALQEEGFYLSVSISCLAGSSN